MPLCDYFAPDQIWTCMAPGSVDDGVIGCEVSCYPCDDVQNMPYRIGVDSYGARWVRPSLGDESRDATGVRRPISSDKPVLLPRGTTYFEIAPCWKQLSDGSVLEQFALTICDCNDACPDPPIECFLEGILHTCFTFAGFRWPPEQFICTGLYVGHVPIPMAMGTNILGQAAFMRTSHPRVVDEPSQHTWCTANLAVYCFGHTVRSNCDQWQPRPPYYADYLFDEPPRTLWDWAGITSFAPQFGQDPDFPDDYKAAVDAKNATMDFIRDDIAQGFDSLLHLDQIDSPRRAASDDENFNSLIDYWSRVWNPRGAENPDEWIAFADLPVVMEFPNSKLVNTGYAVIADYVLMGASIELSMVLHRRKTDDPCEGGASPEDKRAVYPMIRMRVTVWMGMHVRFPDEETRYLKRTWRDPTDQVPLTIVSGYDQPFARITPANSDRIVYIDSAGRTLAPPPFFVWEGSRSFFSDPPTEDRFHHGMYNGGAPQCTAMAAGLDGMIIPAAVSHLDNDEGERVRIWTGSMKFQFDWRA